jgi:hypothetical protein
VLVRSHQEFEELEPERIAVPTFGEIVERLRPLPSFEPSSNEPMPGPGAPADTAIGWSQAGP